MLWPVMHAEDGSSSIRLPDGRWLTYTEEKLADLLLAVILEEPVDDRKLCIARRLAGESRFAEFVHLHAEVERNLRALEATVAAT